MYYTNSSVIFYEKRDTMKECPKCRETMSDRERYCITCGEALGEATTSEQLYLQDEAAHQQQLAAVSRITVYDLIFYHAAWISSIAVLVVGAVTVGFWGFLAMIVPALYFLTAFILQRRLVTNPTLMAYRIAYRKNSFFTMIAVIFFGLFAYSHVILSENVRNALEEGQRLKLPTPRAMLMYRISLAAIYAFALLLAILILVGLSLAN